MLKLKKRKLKKIWKRWESSLSLVMMLQNTQCQVEERLDLTLINMEQLSIVLRLRFKLLHIHFNQSLVHFLMKAICFLQKQRTLDLEIMKLKSIDQSIKLERSLVNQFEKVYLQNMLLQDQISMNLQLIVLENSTSFNKQPKCWIFQLIKSIIQVQIHTILKFFKRRHMGKWKNDHSLLQTISS